MVYFSREAKTKSSYPEKKIKIVVPFTPGGGTDTFVRFIDKTVREKKLLPQNFIIVNKPGGATTIGSLNIWKTFSEFKHMFMNRIYMKALIISHSWSKV